jgi:hypothetical protein
MTMMLLWKSLLALFLPWGGTIAITLLFGRVWWTALRTGRWVLGRGRSYNVPAKPTFTLYDRTANPFTYYSGIIGVAVLFLFYLCSSVAVTIGLAENLHLI